MRINNTVKTAIAGLVMLGTVVGGQSIEANSRMPYKPHKSILANCEDVNIQPCYTYDDGKWRIVYSYSPYKSKAVKLCNSKSSNVPCLNKKETSGGHRIYKWRIMF